MKKERSPKEIIEEEQNKYVGERAYVKFPGEKIVPITLRSEERPTTYGGTRQEADDNLEKLRLLWHSHHKKGYVHVHTHPYSKNNSKFEGKKIRYSPLPSHGDMNRLLLDDSAKGIAIAQFNKDTGKVEGYFYLRKTKSTKPTGYYAIDKDETIKEVSKGGVIRGILKLMGIGLKQRRIIKSTRKYERDSIEVQRADDPEQIFPLVEKLASRYHLQYRFIPAEGYAIDENKVRFIEKQKSLEQKVSSVIAIGGLLSSFFLLGSSVTGNAIGNLGKSSGSWLGIGLFLVGIAGVFWYFHSKKR